MTDRPDVATLPERNRLVLVGVEFLSQFGSRTASGDFLTAEWGEPDEHGWYTPTFTAHADDNPIRDAEEREAALLTRVEELESALDEMRTFAAHGQVCAFALALRMEGTDETQFPCDCGFDAALTTYDTLVEVSR